MFVFLLCIYLWYAVGTSYSVMYMIYLLVGVHTCSENDESSRKMLFVPCSGSWCWCSLYKLRVICTPPRLCAVLPEQQGPHRHSVVSHRVARLCLLQIQLKQCLLLLLAGTSFTCTCSGGEKVFWRSKETHLGWLDQAIVSYE